MIWRDTTALDVRRQQSVILSVMMLDIAQQLARVWPGQHIGRAFENLLVAMLLRKNEAAGNKPLPILRIAKVLNIPRSNVARSVAVLVKLGMAYRAPKGGVFANPDYLAARIDADYFIKARQAVLDAADAFRATMAPKARANGKRARRGRNGQRGAVSA